MRLDRVTSIVDPAVLARLLYRRHEMQLPGGIVLKAGQRRSAS
jgi:hypothetical protein